MTTFNYRANRLELELCGHGHGFWLDYGEDKKVQQFMKQRVADLQRSAAAEVQWRRFLAGAHSKSFFQKVKDFFRGR
jgi:Zn-finger nucleic acid-binding protein